MASGPFSPAGRVRARPSRGRLAGMTSPLLDLGAVRVPGHDGIGPEQALWTAWSLDPQFLVPVALAVFFYFRGLSRWSERSREHPRWRTAVYLTGVGLLVLAIASPLDRLAEHHFSMHMLQHEVVMMWAIPLILLGAPTTPSLRGMPRWLRHRVVRRLARRRTVRLAYRWVTHPAVAVGVLTATLWGWHLIPGWYDAALRHGLVHDAQHLSFAGAALLVWWNVIDPRPLRSRIAYIPRMLYIFAAGVPKHFLAAILTFASTTLYATYEEARPILGLGVLEDQQLAGLLMWVPSVMMHLLAMGVVFAVWAQKSEQRQREIEVARDGQRTALAASD
jgi:putative membrane protein